MAMTAHPMTDSMVGGKDRVQAFRMVAGIVGTIAWKPVLHFSTKDGRSWFDAGSGLGRACCDGRMTQADQWQSIIAPPGIGVF
jgi:hypothetical protein